MRSWHSVLIAGSFTLFLLAANAQQPGKGPMLPPVNPAAAKLDFVVTGLDGPGFAIAYGDKADLLVVGCENGTLHAYKKDILAAFKTGKGEPEVWKGHQGPVREVAWTGGPTLVSVGMDKKIIFRKMPEGKIAQTATVDFRVRAAAMTKEGKLFAAAGESDTIQLFDVASGKATTKLTDKMDWTLCVAFSADGKQLLSGDLDGVARLWDVGGKKIKDIKVLPNPPPKTPPDPVAITSIVFAPDGKTFLAGLESGLIYLVNLSDGKTIRTFTGHTLPVTGLALHPTGTLLASCSKDRTVKLWNPAGPQPALQALKSLDGHDAWIEGIVFIDQATKLATVSADHTIRIWDLADAAKKKK